MIIADSVTILPPDAAGAIVMAGSHCGVYVAHLAAKAGVRAVILNDAGVGRDRAGIKGLDNLGDLGIAAAAVSHNSARIGDGADMMARGVISHANARAFAAGVTSGMSAREALQLLDDRAEEPPSPMASDLIEHRFVLLAGAVVVVDSASLLGPADEGRIIVTGSHGGLLGGRPETALKVAALAAVYNDAGVGIDNAGIGRLQALDARGIAAATVSHDSAWIGDGRSTLEDGRISHCNAIAGHCGVRRGMTTWEFIRAIETSRRKGEH
jgi:uncharacterized protein YunC (DUF1805 family)